MKLKFTRILTIGVIAVAVSVTAFAAGKIVIPTGTAPFAIKEGEGFKTFTVKVIANADTNNLKLTIKQPTGVSATTTPIELANVRYEKTEAVVTAGQTVSFDISAKATSGAREGIYTIPLEISYDGLAIPNQEELFFKVSGNSITSNTPDVTALIIKNFRLADGYDKDPIDPGDEFMVTVMLENKGNTMIEDAKIALKNLTPETFTPVGVGDAVYADIAPGDKSAASFMIRANPGIAAGKHLLTVRIDYRDHNNILKFEEGQMFVTIAGEEKPDSQYSTPIVMIESYTYGGDSVIGGQSFNLSLNFKNTNKLSDVENMKITLSDPNDIYLPKKSSNTIYIEKADADSTFNQTILMQASSTAEPRSYQMTVQYSYETVVNSRRTSVTNTENISIPLTQKELLSVDVVIIPDEILVGEVTPIAANFVNKGKTDIQNLTVGIYGDFVGGEQPYYVGTLSKGRSDSYDANISADTEGDITGYIIFTYDGFEGDTKEYRHEFSTKAVTELSEKKNSQKPVFSVKEVSATEEKETRSLWAKLGLSSSFGVAALVIVAVVAIFYYTKKRKKKS